MTVPLIQQTAYEFAGQFYEQKRSGRFRSMDALTRAKTLKHLPDGTLVEVPVTVPFRQAYPDSQAFAKAHWPLFVDAARRSLITMMALPDHQVSKHMKDTIHAAILAERKLEYEVGGKHLLQQKPVGHVGK